jgi:hypothetical protein
MKGFGGYLQTLDPEQREWQFHAQSSIIFCQIHFQRGVEKLVGKPRVSPLKFGILMDILRCPSKDEYLHACNSIIGN